jgi:hypothetical protein
MPFLRVLVVPLVVRDAINVFPLVAMAAAITNSMVGHDSLRPCFLLLLLLDDVVAVPPDACAAPWGVTIARSGCIHGIAVCVCVYVCVCVGV